MSTAAAPSQPHLVNAEADPPQADPHYEKRWLARRAPRRPSGEKTLGHLLTTF
jgi:hypothetical protein